MKTNATFQLSHRVSNCITLESRDLLLESRCICQAQKLILCKKKISSWVVEGKTVCVKTAHKSLVLCLLPSILDKSLILCLLPSILNKQKVYTSAVYNADWILTSDLGKMSSAGKLPKNWMGSLEWSKATLLWCIWDYVVGSKVSILYFVNRCNSCIVYSVIRLCLYML